MVRQTLRILQRLLMFFFSFSSLVERWKFAWIWNLCPNSKVNTRRICDLIFPHCSQITAVSMGTFLEFYDIHKIWSLANYTLLPQIVNNMFQEYLEDLGGQDWVIEEIDIKKQVFCHLWPLQISVVVVIKVWSPNNWNNGHYIIILLILVARRTLIGGRKYYWHTRCIISITIILIFLTSL